MKVRAMLVLVLLVAGCSHGTPPAPVSAPTAGSPVSPEDRSPADSAPATTAPPVPALRPATACPATLRTTAEGFQLVSDGPGLGDVTWLGSQRLLFGWVPTSGGKPGEPGLCLADLAAGTVRPLVMGELGRYYPDKAGKYAVLAWDGANAGAVLLHADTGKLEPLFSLSPAWPQYNQEAARHWAFPGEGATVSTRWLTPDRLVLTVAPLGGGRNIVEWGKVLLVDIAKGELQVLAEQGQLAATLPDGAALVRKGWVDGALQLWAPPYEAPSPVAPAGPWTWSFAVSADGGQVAWLEAPAPPGDWSQHLPHLCCSTEPLPQVSALGFWERAKGAVRRLPVDGVIWPSPLQWRLDGTAVTFAMSPYKQKGTAVAQAGPASPLRGLAVHEWSGQFQMLAEGPDGSLFYGLTGRLGQNPTSLIRRRPGGKTEILEEGILTAAVDQRGQLVVIGSGKAVIRSLATGAVITTVNDAGSWPRLSPDSHYIVRNGLPDTPLELRISRVG